MNTNVEKFQRKIKLTVFFLSFFAVLIGLSAPAQNAPLAYSLVVKLQKTNGIDQLNFKLKNISTKPIKMYQGKLPWDRNSLTLVAVNMSSGWQLKKVMKIADSPPGMMVISPSEVIEGSIFLASRFENYQKSALADPLVLFWAYNLKAEHDSLGSTGGAVFTDITL